MRKRPFEFKKNVVDRIIEWVDPIQAQQRYAAKIRLAAFDSYTGASKSRRQTKMWHTSGGDPDSDLLPDLPLLRERSRDLIRNAPLAAGAINTKVTNVIGTGLKLQSQIDASFLGLNKEEAQVLEKNIEREFRLWAESQDADITRTLDFYGLQELAFRASLENGDSFALLTRKARVGNPYELSIQLIEADRICNPNNQQDSDTLAGGVERTIEGEPVAYHVTKFHPGKSRLTQQKWERIEAFGKNTGRRNVLHLFRVLRSGQTRGVPDLAPVIETFKQLDRYTEAEIMAAVVSGLFTVFVKSEGEGLEAMTPTSETGAKADDEETKLAPGAILDLMPGEDVSFANPNRPNQAFDTFVQAILRQIGVSLELPYELLIKHFTASYSASRAALLEAWKFFQSRREWIGKRFCNPIYEAWFTEAVILGRIHAPGYLTGDPAIRKAYLKCQWIGPARPQIDELKEVNAAEKRIEIGISTIAEETAQLTGGDWEEKHRQRAIEVEMRRKDGLQEYLPNLNEADPYEDADIGDKS